MNQTESKALLDKLDSLMDAADEFGTESKQLAEARSDFKEYLKEVNVNNEKLKQVIDKCNEYIDEARQMVGRDLSGQIETIVKSTEDAVFECKDHCQELTKEYEEILKTFGGQKEIFEQKQDTILEEVKKNLTGTDNKIDALSNAIDEIHAKNLASIVENHNNVKEELILAANRNADRLSKEQKSNTVEITLDTRKIKSEVENIKKQQAKDHIIVIVSTVCSTIAAIAAIIGLFL